MTFCVVSFILVVTCKRCVALSDGSSTVTVHVVVLIRKLHPRTWCIMLHPRTWCIMLHPRTWCIMILIELIVLTELLHTQSHWTTLYTWRCI